MKKTLSILLVIAFCTVLSGTAQGEELKAQPKACEYQGIVKGKMEIPDRRLTVDTQGVQKEFLFNHDKKKDCSSWEELAVGDNVNVTCKEKKGRLEATCVRKIPKSTLKGWKLEKKEQ